MPTGKPPDIAQGTVMAGWPVTSKGAVLFSISSARAMVSSREQCLSGMRVAFIGMVGMSSRS